MNILKSISEILNSMKLSFNLTLHIVANTLSFAWVIGAISSMIITGFNPTIIAMFALGVLLLGFTLFMLHQDFPIRKFKRKLKDKKETL